jgi:hypothetical protein
MRFAAAFLALIAAACGDPEGLATPIVVDLGAAIEPPNAEGTVELMVDAPAVIEVDLDGFPLIVEANLNGQWVRPHLVIERTIQLEVAGDGMVPVTIWSRGLQLPEIRVERSLTWTEGALLDDPQVAGLATVMAAAAEDGHGGAMLDAWLRRFATTAHSERAGPAQLADEIAAAQGADPTTWDLSLLPFKVTGIHNRIDLAGRSGGCGELRVSLASTHPIYAPFHLIFLFRQEPAADDVSPGGAVHCMGTARRWIRFSSSDGADFVARAGDFLSQRLTHGHFLLAETVELTVSPWEWRQWVPMGGDVLDNPPLFQTVDVEALNAPGPLRDQFLAWVADNASLLDQRQVVIPDQFRSPSARVAQGVPRVPLSLAGIAPGVAAAYPDLRQQIEIIGCPTCHTDDAEFVQTSVDRTFSPFYSKELTARLARIDLMGQGAEASLPPFGPLQELP